MTEAHIIRAAQALLDAQVFGTRINAPITFKSGILSPVYLDNRRLTFYPQAWHAIIDSLHTYASEHLMFDVLAGIETAGIPHSAALAYVMDKPSVFVRKQAKEHGMKKRVEGGDVTGKRVLLLEDQITTGGSSLSGVEALRAEGAIVEDCIAITSYGFEEADAAFAAAGVRLHVLVTFPVLLDEALARGWVIPADTDVIRAWLANPRAWSPKEQS